MISLEKVRYKGILSVDYLNIEEKKITFIVGESGSGKSTLLKLINNMISANNGDIFYKGKNINKINPIDLRKKVVMVPQNIIIFDGTIRENLLKGLELRKETLVDDEILKNILKVVCLEKSLDEKAQKLSGGEKQRLILGRALALQCDVLMLDEPTASLDEKNSEMVFRNIISFAKERELSLIIITHDLRLANIYSERTIEVIKGKVLGE
ncbi:ABC transporter ATP-binding protein [Clostridium sp. LIBA-8841]|uniref:ABC transporter ATP-binding protein n=1 Tax=Clostridium sp. LIBA-8841 TaxID=2987530 RepID=UPI002AC56BB0|nr:ATP-binding cassette domain-containing protein [Clostridium sp. LIBA-8841]MDZ5253044.1 ATP-binding cassette domain-containing protein [Clostridium sp. LIBA-8841]